MANQQTDYAVQYQAAQQNPEAYWAEQAGNINWFSPPQTTLEALPNGSHRWYPDGELNSCYLALDQHLETRVIRSHFTMIHPPAA